MIRLSSLQRHRLILNNKLEIYLTMKNDTFKNVISPLLSGIAIILSVVSVIAIFIKAPRTPGLPFDYLGILVTILSTLVMLLLGWQIYNALELEKQFEEYKDEVNENLKNEKEKLLSKINSDIEKNANKATGVSLLSLGLIQFNDIQKFRTLVDALSYFNKFPCNDDEADKTQICIDTLNELADKYKNKAKINFSLSNNDKRSYRKIVEEFLNDKNEEVINNICDFILKF